MLARARIFAVALATVVAGACGDTAPPTRPTPIPNNPPVITGFRPELAQLDVFIGDNVDFVVDVADPEGENVASTFFLDGEPVSHTFWWRYAVRGTGPATVRAVASDGINETEKVWNLHRRDATADPVVITHFDRTGVPGEIALRWIAGRDNDGGALATYRVRTSLQPITTNQVWTLATTHSDVPAAAVPGEEMSMILTGLPPKSEVFVAVRGVGSLGQFSVLGESPSVMTEAARLSGHVFEAGTSTPLEGLTVRLGALSTVTDADGAYLFDNLAQVTGYLLFTDDDAPGPGVYWDNRRNYTWRYADQIDVQLLPVQGLQSDDYPDFLTMFLHFVRVPGIPYPLGTRRWELPIDVYVPPRTSGGLDYQTVILDAMDDLEQVFARDLFNVVASAPDTGLTFEYNASISRDNYDIYEWTTDYFPLRARVQMRTLYDASDAITFRTVVRHEFGHVLGLMSHSVDTGHLMVGGQAPVVQHFTEDELAVLAAYLSMERGADLSLIIDD